VTPDRDHAELQSQRRMVDERSWPQAGTGRSAGSGGPADIRKREGHGQAGQATLESQSDWDGAVDGLAGER
jgi:hypothetical protein